MDVGRAEWAAACALRCRQDAIEVLRLVAGRDDPGALVLRKAADELERRAAEFERLWRLGERGVGLPAPGSALAEPPAPERSVELIQFVGGPRDGRVGALPARCSCGGRIHNGSLLALGEGALYVVDVEARRARHVPPDFLGARSA